MDPKLWEDREDEENPSLDDKTDGADEKQDQLAAKESEKNVEGAETDEPKKDGTRKVSFINKFFARIVQ